MIASFFDMSGEVYRHGLEDVLNVYADFDGSGLITGPRLECDSDVKQMPRSPLRIAAPSAALMLAAQVGGKAFRDATFLSAWPAETLPIVAACSAVFVVILVQVFGRASARFEAGVVVAWGFVLSAGAHAVEWLLLDSGRWIAFAIYVHFSTVGGVLLSAFWSLIAERFDPTGARASYGQIAAAGTAGGLAGGLVVARLAAITSPGAVLIMQMALQLLCAAGVLLLRAAPPLFPVDARAARPAASAIREVMGSPYLRTIGVFAITTSAAAAVLDYVFKATTRAAVGTGPTSFARSRSLCCGRCCRSWRNC